MNLSCFVTGFEKRSFLQDLWKGRKALLDKAVGLKLKTRVANTPSVTYKEEGLRGALSNLFKSQKGSTLDAQAAKLKFSQFPASTLIRGGQKPDISVTPSNSMTMGLLSKLPNKRLNSIGKGMRDPQSHAAMAHHELDEAASYHQKGFSPSMVYKPKPISQDDLQPIARGGASIGENIKSKNVKGALSSAADTFRDIKQLNADAKRRAALPSAAHMGPEVLINESNRVFHEMQPDSAAHFKNLRSGNEADVLKRHGLRYGDEYVQPGTHRYNKLVSNVNKTLEQAGGDSEKLFPPKRNGPPPR